jgi:hypothetical protein
MLTARIAEIHSERQKACANRVANLRAVRKGIRDIPRKWRKNQIIRSFIG